MRYLIVLLVCVPLQFALIAYRKPVEKLWTRGIDFLRKNINYSITIAWKWLEDLEDELPINDEPTETTDNYLEPFTVKTSRPPEVKFRVGQVVVNTRVAFIGIIIGWNYKQGAEEPVYELLTDHPNVPDYKTKSMQSELVLLEYVQIYHPEAAKYFDMFDYNKSQYMPQPWLRIIYPTD